MRTEQYIKIGRIEYWLGLALLMCDLGLVLSSPDPKSMNHSGPDWVIICCGLFSFTLGGFTYFLGQAKSGK